MHQRRKVEEGGAPGEDEVDGGEVIDDSSKSTRQQHRSHFVLPLLLGSTSALGLAAYLLPLLTFLRIATLLPVAVSVYVAVVRQTTLEGRLVPLALFATVVSAQVPGWMSSLVSVCAITAFSWVPSPLSQSAMPVLVAAVAVASVLLVENFMVWVVSATFLPGQSAQTAPPALQDNGRLVLQSSGLSKADVVSMRRLWNVQWSLVACLGAAFVRRHVYRGTLFPLAARACWTLAVARFIRTVSFVLTVLPSQNPQCYRQHYPPPPDDWWEWIAVGLLPASHGGCNDLIISGHATVTSTLACVATHVAEDPVFGVALWVYLVMDYCVEVYEGFHYSVDMWLGMVLVSLIWRVLEPLEQGTMAVKRAPGMISLDTRSAIWFACPSLVTWLQLVVLPESTANATILLYLVGGAYLYLGVALRTQDATTKSWYQQIAQHLFFLLLYMALGIYL